MKTAKLIVVALALLVMLSHNADAQRFKLPFGKSKSEGERSDSIQLTQRAGPWLIMCASFVGEDGRQQARRLAQELREKHRLNSYVYSHEFDFAAEIAGQGLGWEVFDLGGEKKLRPKRMKPAGESQFEEIAVLVGDFASVEDARAQKMLAQIKTLQPESMAYNVQEAVNDSALAGSRLRAWRDFSKLKSEDPKDKLKGPMKAAFMMPNPLLPDAYFAARKVDVAVLNWRANKGSKYSLLKNESTYTVKIASFGGESTMELEQIERTRAEESWRHKNGKGITESKLFNAAKKATVLTDYLRKQGIEAYEFHDRYESYVCVGGYDWLVKEDETGMKRNHPGMVETINKFKGTAANLAVRPGAIRSYTLPSKLAKAGIACDLQPLPVLVPKAPEQSASRRFGLLK